MENGKELQPILLDIFNSECDYCNGYDKNMQKCKYFVCDPLSKNKAIKLMNELKSKLKINLNKKRVKDMENRKEQEKWIKEYRSILQETLEIVYQLCLDDSGSDTLWSLKVYKLREKLNDSKNSINEEKEPDIIFPIPEESNITVKKKPLMDIGVSMKTLGKMLEIQQKTTIQLTEEFIQKLKTIQNYSSSVVKIKIRELIRNHEKELKKFTL